MEQKNPYRFVICGCSMALVFISIGLLSNSFPAYYPFIIHERHFTNTQTGLLTTMRTVVAALSMLMADRYYRRLNVRMGVAITLSVTTAAYFIYAFSDSLFCYYLAAGMTGIGYGIGGMMPASLLIKRWFRTKTASAMGVASTGSAIASIIGPSLITYMVNHVGLARAFLMEALFLLAVSVLIFILVRNEPENSNDHASANDCNKNERMNPSCPRTDTISGLQICMIGISGLIGTLGVTAFGSLSLLYTTAGKPMNELAPCLSALGLFLMMGQLLYGWITDHIGHWQAAAFAGTSWALGFFLCSMAESASTLLILLTFLVLGIGCSLSTVAFTILATDFSRPECYTSVLKNYQAAYSAGGLVSSLLPGLIADWTGSYVPAYRIFFVFAYIIAIGVLCVYKKWGNTEK